MRTSIWTSSTPRTSAEVTLRESLQRDRQRSAQRRLPSAWNALEPGGNPFVRHEFLLALERDGLRRSRLPAGLPRHLLLQTASGELRSGAAPVSARRFVGRVRLRLELGARVLAGRPALLPEARQHAAVHAGDGPSPAVAADARSCATATAGRGIDRATRAANACRRPTSCSSTDADRAALERAGFLWRKDCQFHWHNRDYASFDAFLATFRAEKRKKALRERRRVQESGISVPHAARRGNGRATVGHRVRILRRHVRGARPRALPQRGVLPLVSRRRCPGSRHGEAGRVRRARRSRRRSSSAAATRCTVATGARPASFTACISRRATTRASSTASSRACSASSRARRASTRCRAASSRRRPGRRTGSPIRASGARSTATWSRSARRSIEYIDGRCRSTFRSTRGRRG